MYSLFASSYTSTGPQIGNSGGPYITPVCQGGAIPTRIHALMRDMPWLEQSVAEVPICINVPNRSPTTVGTSRITNIIKWQKYHGFIFRLYSATIRYFKNTSKSYWQLFEPLCYSTPVLSGLIVVDGGSLVAIYRLLEALHRRFLQVWNGQVSTKLFCNVGACFCSHDRRGGCVRSLCDRQSDSSPVDRLAHYGRVGLLSSTS